uniref:4.9 kDa nonstructural protein n=1 Tax=Bovine coronavirus Bubalus/Italy/179/07-11 TaxID=473588 RepID=A8HB17_9BETC|nr:4.9 kDa nonstructural protein [Bovine coronavirus Bubalus/Italy/179/07-11]
MTTKFVFDLLAPDDILHPFNHVKPIIRPIEVAHIIIATTTPAV